ncbi:hypothetical protein KIL84_005226 [Mauremys mutica]|uniref:Uncharacterized protein n=1 Tax=Mauremys mutica TaxID=74926 RepID=A0A9D4B5X0_9SAUR|nr:hypothetical protein KIL84_005226 [Mauremys mutica]
MSIKESTSVLLEHSQLERRAALGFFSPYLAKQNPWKCYRDREPQFVSHTGTAHPHQEFVLVQLHSGEETKFELRHRTRKKEAGRQPGTVKRQRSMQELMHTVLR